MVEEVGYDSAFTFIFSPRRGHVAADMPDQVPHEVKRERMERLVEAVQRRATERAQRFVGRTMDVLVEGPSRTDPSRLRGPHAPQQDRELPPASPTAGELRAGGDRVRHEHHARRFASGCSRATRLDGRTRRVVVAVFGPTGWGRPTWCSRSPTCCAVRGEDPVAISADALQVYRGLGTLTGAADARGAGAARAPARVRLRRSRETFSVGEFMPLAHAEIDARARRPAAARSSSAAPASTCARR